MEREKKTFVEWIKAHKTELIIAGISITAIVGIIIGIKKYQVLEEEWISLKNLVEKPPENISFVKMSVDEEINVDKEVIDITVIQSSRTPHNVSEHLRNLPEGWKASAEKIAMAAEHGYELLPGQTWVEAYRTGGLAA